MRTSHNGPLARDARTMSRIVQFGEDRGLASADWVLACADSVFVAGTVRGSRKDFQAWMNAFTELAGEPDLVQRIGRARVAAWSDYEGILVQLASSLPGPRGDAWR